MTAIVQRRRGPITATIQLTGKPSIRIHLRWATPFTAAEQIVTQLTKTFHTPFQVALYVNPITFAMNGGGHVEAMDRTILGTVLLASNAAQARRAA